MLYFVAVPIGHLADISLRALEVLKKVDAIICEDTRHSLKLLNHHHIQKPLLSLHDYSSKKDLKRIIAKLLEGQSLALISDAGTPLISDPGFDLLQQVQELKLPYTSIPGSSSVINALVLSGLPPYPFVFHGFCPEKSLACNKFLESLSPNLTHVFFESPRRVIETLEKISKLYPQASLSLCREMTKTYEEVITGTALYIWESFTKRPEVLGEIVLCLHIKAPKNTLNSEILAQLKILLTYLSGRDAAKALSLMTHIPKSDLYAAALEIQGKTR